MIEFTYRDLTNWIVYNKCNKITAKQVTKLNLTDSKVLVEIPKEIRYLTQLKQFWCGFNSVPEIPKEISYLTQLQELCCTWNFIEEIPKEMSCLSQLQIFDCSWNNIKEIPKEISYLTQLKKFNCEHNKIKKIPKEISHLTQLQSFKCGINKIEKIPIEIIYLTQLQIFECENNKIKKFPKKISHLIQLQEFNCSLNQIKEIPKEISYFTQLQSFRCCDNQIKEIPIEIMNCRNLNYFAFNRNQIDYIQPQIRRWLNRFKHEQQLYEDTQSVHNHAIQEGVSKSINYITSIKPTIKMEKLKELIINNQYLNEHVKRLLFEYMDNKEVHTILNITFEELLLSVYDFIERNENKEDIYKIMNEEMTEANCKCFTGRISRLINVLNGYDEHIEIHIADNEQIGNIISLIREKFGENYEENEFKRLVHEELTIRQYSEETINEWLNNI